MDELIEDVHSSWFEDLSISEDDEPSVNESNIKLEHGSSISAVASLSPDIENKSAVEDAEKKDKEKIMSMYVAPPPKPPPTAAPRFNKFIIDTYPQVQRSSGH